MEMWGHCSYTSHQQSLAVRLGQRRCMHISDRSRATATGLTKVWQVADLQKQNEILGMGLTSHAFDHGSK